MRAEKQKHPQGVEQFADSRNALADAPKQYQDITLDGQLSLFDAPKLRITKPLRLIELFSGIGAQAKALERLGVPFEHWGAYDIDKYAVAAYNAIHGTDYVPTDITKMTADDLNIVDTEHYTYLLTYSFPCQDLSLAGLGKGMSKGSGTRSGLLWEVERLLNECKELPQILVMENVKQVISKKNKQDFDLWRESLRGLGYESAYQVMNAKDYGVAQNRERCFMVSWLGNLSYVFPDRIPLHRRLRDYLETDVEDRYYLTEEQISTFVARSEEHKKNGNGFTFDPIDVTAPNTHTHTPHTQLETTTETRKTTTSPIGQIASLQSGTFHQWGNVYSPEQVAPTHMANCHNFPTLVAEQERERDGCAEISKSILAKQRDWLTGTYISVGSHNESVNGQDPSVGNSLLNGWDRPNTDGKRLEDTDPCERGGGQPNVIGTVESANGNRGFKNAIYGTDGTSPTLLARDYKDPVRIGWDD